MQLLGGFLNIVAFILNIPFFIPLSKYVWIGIVAFNFNVFPIWIWILLLFWSFIIEKGDLEAYSKLDQNIDKNGITNENTIYSIILKLYKWPIFIAAVYVLMKIS